MSGQERLAYLDKYLLDTYIKPSDAIQDAEDFITTEIDNRKIMGVPEDSSTSWNNELQDLKNGQFIKAATRFFSFGISEISKGIETQNNRMVKRGQGLVGLAATLIKIQSE